MTCSEIGMSFRVSSDVHENMKVFNVQRSEGEIYLRTTGTKLHTIGKYLHLSVPSICIAKVDDCWNEGFELRVDL